MNESTVEQYLQRLDIERASVSVDLVGLTRLQHAHLAHIPFENLDIVFAGGVAHDRSAALTKLLTRRRGGWCFELNGPFGLLLEALGFGVRLLGCAVLLDGPSAVIEHLALEVATPDVASPMFVDVGFGSSAVRPLALNATGPQDGGDGTYEFFASPQGTTLTRVVDGVPEALLRFKRVAHRFEDFAETAAAMQVDPTKHWSTKPFATRLVSTEGFDRVTLTTHCLTFTGNGDSRSEPLTRSQWDDSLAEWFAMTRPGPWPESTST